jgi:hypothetical protein
MIAACCSRDAYNDSRNAVLWVAVALQVLRDWDEDARWERHVEYAVRLLATLLELLEVLLQLLEGLVLVVLAGNVCAEAAELVQLLLDLLCGYLDVGLDALEVLVVVHLRPCITNDAEVLGEEVVAVLDARSMGAQLVLVGTHTRPKSAGNCACQPRCARSCRSSTHCLLLGQIARSAQDHYDGVVFELLVAV